MPQLLDRLAADHSHLTRLLNLFDALLDRFHEGSETDFELMCEMLEYMESYADNVHQPSEEVIFDRLRARGTGHQVLDELTRQHLELPEMNRKFRRSLEGIVREEVLRRDEVEAQGRELLETLRAHLDLEETKAFDLMRENLTETDWEELLTAVPIGEDPLFGIDDRARFRALFQHLEEQAQP